MASLLYWLSDLFCTISSLLYRLCGLFSTMASIDETSDDEGSISDEICDEDYYQGHMHRTDAEALLKEEGDFLVRYAQHHPSGVFVLCICVKGETGRVWNFWINTDASKALFVDETTHKDDSVSNLINWYRETGTPLTAASNAKLKRPIDRPPWALDHDGIFVINNIGQGAFSELSLAWLVTVRGREKTVVNALKFECGRYVYAKYMAEARMMRKYDHPNVIKIVGVAVHRFPLCVVMEYCEGGTMLSYLVQNGTTMFPKEKNRLVAEAAEGLAYLEQQNCIHRGVAAKNFLLSGRNNTVKISNFELSYDDVIVYEDTIKKIGLVPEKVHWLAPESLQDDIYSLKSDVFAFGVLVWEIHSNGAEPFPGLTGLPRARRMETLRGLGTRLTLARIVVQCWERIADDRPAISALLPDLKKLLLPVHYHLEDDVDII